MKKIILSFALLGLFAFIAPKNAVAGNSYPGTYVIEGNICFCHDAEDYAWFENYFKQ